MPLSVPQRQIVAAPQRFKVAVCGRRFGKTTLAIWLMCREASQPNREIFYIAPTYRQAKMIAWKKLKNKLLDLRWVNKINETELSIVLKNNSTISLKGADGGAQNLRGVGLDAVILDEASIIDEEAWTEVLRPALADKQGWALFISTPAGMNWLKDLYDLAEEFPEEWASFQFTSLDGGNIPLAEIEAARRTLDAKTFEQEFLASFVNFTGRIFYAFERGANLRAWTGPVPANLHVGLDFNVDNNSAVIAVRVDQDQLHIIDEIRLQGSNTDEMVLELKTRYPQASITVYPDPSGSARRTSAGGRTDHSILRTAGFTVKSPNSHNAVRDGINAVNARLRNSQGQVNLFIDPRCRSTIESLEKHVYKPNSSVPDKDSGFDHFSDALRYLTEYLFPIRGPQTAPPRMMWSHKLS
jgi:hypothetical protein